MMTFSYYTTSALVLAGLTAVGCSTADSSELATSEIAIQWDSTVANDANGGFSVDSTCFVKKGGTDFTSVDLTAGDELHLVTDQGDDILADAFSTGHYTFRGAIKDPGTLKLELRRTTGTSALGTSAQVPPTFAFTSESIQNKTFAANDTIDLAWSNPVTSGSVFVMPSASPCGGTQLGGQAETVTLSDTGKGSIRAGDLLASAPDAAGVCVTLTLQRAGGARTLDPALYPLGEGSHDSSIAARRNVTFDIKIVP